MPWLEQGRYAPTRPTCPRSHLKKVSVMLSESFEGPIFRAVVTRSFDHLTAALQPAVAGHGDSRAGLLNVCHAYLAFAQQHPHIYRVFFERHSTCTPENTADVHTMFGADAFRVLVNAVQTCIDQETGPLPIPWTVCRMA